MGELFFLTLTLEEIDFDFGGDEVGLALISIRFSLDLHDRNEFTISGLDSMLGAIMSLTSHLPPFSRDERLPGNQSGFETTLWTVVLQASQGESPDSRAALERLCRKYWYPLYAFVRRQGYDRAQAQDLTQEFFCRMIRDNYLQAANKSRGRFRSFLLTACKHFLANEWNRGQAQKRGGGAVIFSLEAEAAEERYAFEPVDTRSPEKIYEQRWAQALVEQVMARLGSEFAEAGKADRFEVLKAFLLDDDARSQAEMAAHLGMSESAVKSAVHRMRQRYGELFREEIANTVASPGEIDEEIRELFAALSS